MTWLIIVAAIILTPIWLYIIARMVSSACVKSILEYFKEKANSNKEEK